MSEKEVLVEQIRKARIAQDAYEGYFKEYIESRKQNLVDAFTDCDNHPDTLTHIKHCMDALRALEASMLSDIESGKLASVEINSNRSMN